ncbi:MAG: carboxypeptidase-like regulatory domain-containing protein [Planctomycetaceae bacterium]|nr:carboxypeptidase-like regulatory domain-containing protein [Planctomycetaceae bacterium]
MTKLNKFLFFVAFAILFTTGCTDKVRVTGTVKYTDGEALTQGSVFFRNAEGTHMFHGALDQNGAFALGEIRDGDGIPSGTYTAWIAGANTSDYEQDAAGNLLGRMVSIIIDPKYESPETSGLSFMIDKSRHRIEIEVERPQ